MTVLVDNLPGPGNYQTNMVAFGSDGKMYFSQGAMTNTGVVGTDAYEIGWLKRLPHAHDIPGLNITLLGENYETPDPTSGKPGARAVTGAFVPFGTRTQPGQRIAGHLPCTCAVMRCDPDGSHLELVAWGLRNAYALGFLSDGRLLVVDQGADDRGSRPVGNAPDVLFEVKAGAWYGWPDYIDGDPITDAQYRPARGPAPTFIIEHAGLPQPERGLFHFLPHTAAVKFDAVPQDAPQWAGEIFIALFGDERPMTAPLGPRAGRSVARIDPATWTLHPFIQGQLNRPIDVRYSPFDRNLYVLDFGAFEMTAEGVSAHAKTGALWRVRHSE